MYTRLGCTSLLFTHLLPSALFASSAAISPNKETSTSLSTSEYGIIRQQNSTPKTLTTTLILPLSIPKNTTATTSTIIPIPGTDISLRITYIGDRSFAPSLLEALLGGAYEQISDAVASHPDDRVAPLPWFYQTHSKQWRDTIAVRIRGNEDKGITWRQLYWVLTGLLGFMEGEPSQLHPMNFDVDVVGEGVVGAGVLWYSRSRGSGEADRRRGWGRGDGLK